MRDIAIIDSELRLVAALRRAAQERGGPLPSIDVPLRRSDGEEAPLAGHALELVSSAVLELES
jgi:hypothetical protein